MPSVRRKVSYDFSTGARERLLTESFQLNGQNIAIAFLLQAKFTGLDVASAATVYLMVSNDGSTWTRVTGKEFVIAGSGTTSFLIQGDGGLAKASYLQLGITGVAGTGQLTDVLISY